MAFFNACQTCGAQLQQKGRGRPRRFCSGACRMRDWRRRRMLRAYAVFADSDQPLPADYEVDELLDEVDLRGFVQDPDERVAETVMAARALVASFSFLGTVARPTLAYRCGEAAREIAEVLHRRFEE